MDNVVSGVVIISQWHFYFEPADYEYLEYLGKTIKKSI
jgi:hypothetical protein